MVKVKICQFPYLGVVDLSAELMPRPRHASSHVNDMQKMTLNLGVNYFSAETCKLDAKTIGAEVQGHFLRVVDVAICVARTWHELGAEDLGAELWKLTKFNFYCDLDIKKCGYL